MNHVRKLIPYIVILLFAGVALFFFVSYKSGSAQELKNPILCPPGQEEQAGCKWCQHRITGNCMWLPADAVAGPWVEVSPPGYCPPLQPQQTLTATSTATSVATSTATTAATATATTPAMVTLTATATSIDDPTSTPGATQPPATPEPRQRPPKPGGTGNLGYIILGVTAVLGLLAGGSLLLTSIARKQY
jgi:hypothetical protein